MSATTSFLSTAPVSIASAEGGAPPLPLHNPMHIPTCRGCANEGRFGSRPPIRCFVGGIARRTPPKSPNRSCAEINAAPCCGKARARTSNTHRSTDWWISPYSRCAARMNMRCNPELHAVCSRRFGISPRSTRQDTLATAGLDTTRALVASAPHAPGIRLLRSRQSRCVPAPARAENMLCARTMHNNGLLH